MIPVGMKTAEQQKKMEQGTEDQNQEADEATTDEPMESAEEIMQR
jgi:hypothetical protein